MKVVFSVAKIQMSLCQNMNENIKKTIIGKYIDSDLFNRTQNALFKCLVWIIIQKFKKIIQKEENNNKTKRRKIIHLLFMRWVRYNNVHQTLTFYVMNV